MAQILFGSDTTPANGDLDSNFSELYARIAPVASTYTPTLTLVSNADAAVANANTAYTRLGSVVSVSGSITIDPTAGAAATSIGISLPVASNLTAVNQLAGVATRFSGTVASLSAGIGGDPTNDRATLQFLNDADTSSRTWVFQFSYLVV